MTTGTNRVNINQQTGNRKAPLSSSRPSLVQSTLPDPTTVRPYRIHILFNCGCGYSTDSMKEAVYHCESYKHSVTVTGGIRYLHHIPHSKVAETEQSQKKYATSYDELRKKLSEVTEVQQPDG